MDASVLSEASSSESKKQQMFNRLVSQPGVFFQSQQRGEPDLTTDDKLKILDDLLTNKPSAFLSRYYKHIDLDWLECFPQNECQTQLDILRAQPPRPTRQMMTRNRRYVAMQKLKDKDEYFSLEKMRERAPDLFDNMIGGHLLDSEKLQLRPTVEIREGGEFSNLMEQLDESQRISDRRKRHLAQWEEVIKADNTDRFMSHVSRRTEADDAEFQMEFDSDDEEGRVAEAKRQKILKQGRYNPATKEVPNQFPADPQSAYDETTRQMKQLKVREEHPDDPVGNVEMQDQSIESEPECIQHDDLIDEFRTIMEERFLRGEDTLFVDYNKIDSDEECLELCRIRTQDEEDAYFADIDD